MEVSDYGGVRSKSHTAAHERRFGQEIYMTMMQSGENVLCPECAKKKYKKENEK